MAPENSAYLMKILITGVTGFIGKACATHCLLNGYDVVGIGRSVTPIQSERFLYIQQDILECDFSELFKKFSFDAVIHLASIQPATSATAEKILLTNGCVLERLLEAGEGISKWIVASSMNVYGIPASLPVTESMPLQSHGNHLYSLSKLVQEAIVSRFSDRSITVLRLSSVFGKGHDHGIVFTMLDSLRQGHRLDLFSGGKTIKEMIYIRDAVTVIMALLNSSQDGTPFLNIGYGETKSAYEIAGIIKNKLNASSEIRCVETKSNRDYSFYYDVTCLKALYPQLPSLTEALHLYIEEMTS